MKKVVSILVVAVMLLAQLTTAFAYYDMSAAKATTAPTIDGVFNSSEWGDPIMTLKEGAADVLASTPADKFSADIYARWDETNFYMAAVVTQATHQNDKTGGDIWQEDNLQICIAGDWEKRNDMRNEFGFALATDGTTIMTYPWASAVGQSELACDTKIVRADGKTTYEIAIPWTSIGKDIAAAEGKDIAFSAAFNAFIDGARQTVEYGKAIVASKDTTESGKLTLVAAPAVADTTATSASASKTGDSNVAIIIALVSAAVVLTVLKLRAQKD